jgi:hypothetical protein
MYDHDPLRVIAQRICAAAHCDNGAVIDVAQMRQALALDIAAGANRPTRAVIARIVQGDELADGCSSTAWANETYPHVSALLEDQQ